MYYKTMTGITYGKYNWKNKKEKYNTNMIKKSDSILSETHEIKKQNKNFPWKY